MKLIGGILIGGGLVSVIGYLVYLFVRTFLLNTTVPLMWRLAPAAILAGTILLVISVIYDRITGRDTQQEEE